MHKYALVNLKGGLGNQIFQISFANYLRILGINTFLDISFYENKHQFPRNIEIDLQQLGFKYFKLKSNLIFKINKSLFWEDDTFNLVDLKKYNRFVGYYQNLKYLEESKTFLQTKINLENKNEDNKNLCAIHIRKTDYSIINQELKNEYYQLSIKKLLSINNKIKFDIYTDDVELKLDSKIFKNVNNIYLPSFDEKPLDVLRKMLNYKYYIIANSSFSAIASYLSEHENKVVIYPKPWWRDSTISLTNIPSGWIGVSNN